MMQDASFPLSLFYCYAHEDVAFCVELDKHLAMLKRLKWIQSWSDYDILAGTETQKIIDDHLGTADLVLLLISADFIDSDYCYSAGMQKALARHQAGEAIVIPILVRYVEWEQTPLATLQALPREGLPVTSWDNPDEAWTEIAAEIRKVVEALRKPVIIIFSPSQHTTATRLMASLTAQHIPAKGKMFDTDQMILKEDINTACAIIYMHSHEYLQTPLHKAVEDFATIYQCPIFYVRTTQTHSEEAEGVSLKHQQDYISSELEITDENSVFQKLLSHLKLQRQRTLSSVAPVPQESSSTSLEPRNPYKGLRPFTPDDARDFFGRDTYIDDSVSMLKVMFSLEERGKQYARLITVIGPSGSGKSSFVMAGLLPHLQAGEVSGSNTWVYLHPLIPGTHPVEALALAIFEWFPEKSLSVLCNDLQDNTARGLHRYITAIVKQKRCTHVVLVVDQFEELFTLTTDEKERRLFIDLLVTACTQQRSPLIVIITLRADFYDRPMQYPALYTLIEQFQIPLLPIGLDDLRAVITRPATLPDVQLMFEDNLIGDILFDLQGQIGALPLLQFTLDQLFQRREGRQITLQAYAESGGVKGALSQHVERIYQGLPSEEYRTATRELFLRLIDPGMTEQDTTRRRTPLSEFIFPDRAKTQHVQEIIEVFIKARLLTTNQSNNVTTIEVSHEAIIREWKRLASWLREAREDIHFQKALSEDVMEWKQRQRPRDRLYRGAQLKEAQKWAKRHTPSSQETVFLRASAMYQTVFLMGILAGLFLLVFSTGAAILYYQRQAPSPLVVTNTQDGMPGSLRWCIETSPLKSTIGFDPNIKGPLVFSGSQIVIPGGKDLTIKGAGRLIRSGDAHAGILISRSASLTIDTLNFQGNPAADQSFFTSEGSLTLISSTISGNVSKTSGGGISNTAPGITRLINSKILRNSSKGDGGGISNSATLILTNSDISNNIAFVEGGGIHNLDGSLTLINTTISNNTAFSEGGGIHNLGGPLTLTNTTVSGNVAFNPGGGIYNEGGSGLLTNSTISDNTSIYDVGGGFDQYYDRADKTFPLTILFCTFYHNSSYSGGGIWINPQSAIENELVLENSIVAANYAQQGPDVFGKLITKGYNLFQSFAGASFSDPEQLHMTDREIRQLSDLHIASTLGKNGGTTLTYALLSGSPAIDAIPLDACDLSNLPKNLDGHPTDQRGEERPQGPGCDIGSYEYLTFTTGS